MSLLSEIQQFAAIFADEPDPVQDIIVYYLCHVMCEAGKMRLIETKDGQKGPTCIFETTAGDSVTLSVAMPTLSKETESALVAGLREILDQPPST